jgi:uroporphyrinogen III methyltransferase/synthase
MQAEQSRLAFVTGHEDPAKEKSNINWSALKGIGTLVFLMGVKNLPHITAQLLKHGMALDTPIALVRWGTTPQQTALTGTLENIVEKVKQAGLKAPAIIVVGDVVQLRKILNWYETKPLFGKRIVVTRAREQASNFRKRLALLGAECIEFPTIEIIPPERWGPVDQAIERIEKYDWLIFTSVNGV